MPWDNAIPFGVRDARVTPFTTPAATTLGTSGDFPNIQTLSFSESEDYEELRGDDALKAIVGLGPSVEWEMENGGISITAYKTVNGGTITSSGTTPAQVTTYAKKVTDIRPYFKAEGQSISDMGGDFHVALYKCRASNRMEGELADGSFWVTGMGGVSLPATLTGKIDYLYEFIVNETAVALT